MIPKNDGSLKVSTPSDREIRMVRVFDAPRALVFDAFTKPEFITRWLYGPDKWSLEVCEMDLRAGGRYRWVWRGPDGESMGAGGVYREVVAPERTVATERFDEEWYTGEAIVTTEFTEHAGRTTMTMTILHVSRESRDRALQSGMEHGMAMSCNRLAGVLESLLAGGPQ